MLAGWLDGWGGAVDVLEQLSVFHLSSQEPPEHPKIMDRFDLVSCGA